MYKSFLLILIICIQYTFAADNNNVILKKAEDHYKSKNYTSAIQEYNSIINKGYYSYQLYYNLGNAYFKNNEIGKSILYYEKAKNLNASDADINYNLSLAYAKTIDKIDTKDNFFIELTHTGFLNTINPNSFAYLSIIFSIIFTLIVTLLLYVSKYRKLLIAIAGVSLTAIITTYIIGSSALKSQASSDFAVVTVKQTKVSNEPIQNAVTKFNLHEGTKVKVLQTVENFTLIKLDNGVEGWVDANAIELI